MYWTIESDRVQSGRITMCEAHALEATNLGVIEFAETRSRPEPDLFESMEEAVAVLGALMAAIGHDLGITSGETGPCDECTFLAETGEVA